MSGATFKTHKHRSLDWIAPGMDDTLATTRRLVESYLSGNYNTQKLVECQALLESVYTSLERVGLPAARLLVEQLTTLINAIKQTHGLGPVAEAGQARVTRSEDAYQALVGGLTQLPNYLVRVRSSGHEQSGNLIAVINDVRAAANLPLLLDASALGKAAGDVEIYTACLFSIPVFNYPSPAVSSLSPDHKSCVAQLLTSGQQLLRDIDTQPDDYRNLTARLADVTDELAAIVAAGEILWLGQNTEPKAVPIFTAMNTLLVATIHSSGRLSLCAKYSLVRSFDLIEQSLNQADIDTEHTIKELLFCIATCDSKFASVYEFKQRFGLLQALSLQHPSEMLRLGTPDADTMDIVFDGLSGDIAVLKVALERFADGGVHLVSDSESVNSVSLPDMAAMARTLQHTMRLAQFDGWAEHMTDMIADLVAMHECVESVDNAATVQRVADTLHMIENGLRQLHIGGSRSESEISALQEAKSSIAHVRGNISVRNNANTDFFDDSQFLDFEPLAEITAELKQVCGAMRMMDIPHLVDAVNSVEAYVQLVVCIGKNTDDIDQLLDALVCIESYIEAAKYDQQQRIEQWLLGAINALAQTGQPQQDPNTVFIPVVSNEGNVDAADHTTANVHENTNVAMQTRGEEQAALEGEFDVEIVEIFLEEAQEVLESLQSDMSEWLQQPEANETMTEIRRGFHTLKGSGRMAGAEHVGEVAWAIENLLNCMVDGTVPVDTLRASLIYEAVAYMPHIIASFEQRLVPYVQPMQSLIQRAELLTNDSGATIEIGNSLDLLADIEAGQPAISISAEIESTGIVAVEDDIPVVSGPLTDTAIPVVVETPEFKEPLALEEPSAVKEPSAVEEPSAKKVSSADEEPFSIEQPLAGQQLSTDDNALNNSAEGIAEDSSEDSSEDSAEDSSEDSAEDSVDASAAGEVFGDSVEDDHYLQAIFISELEEQLMVVNTYLSDHAANNDIYPSEAVERALHTLAGGARIAGNQLIADLFAPAEILVSLIRKRCRISDGEHSLLANIYDWTQAQLTAGTLASVSAGDQQRADLFMDELNQAIAAGLDTHTGEQSLLVENDIIFSAGEFLQSWRVHGSAPDSYESMLLVLDQLQQAATDGHQSAIQQQCQALYDAYQCFVQTGLHYRPYTILLQAHNELENMLDRMAAGQLVEPSASLATLHDAIETEQQLLGQIEKTSSTTTDTVTRDTGGLNGVDREIVAIFLDESDDLIEDVEAGVQQWLNNRDDQSYLERLLRPLHTIKGGARMAGLAQVGDLSHEFETLLLSASNGDTKTDARFFKRASKFVTDLVASVSSIRHSLNAGDEETTVQDSDAPVNEEEKRDEVIRVSSSLLENLVNLAGETSISRSLVEEQVSDFSLSIDEIDATIERLKEQLRRLEIEMEAQIEFRKEQVESEGHEEFDPLEMDRYSQVQQLSKSLVESASDLKDLKTTLNEKTRDMETLLLQQSRINTSLQEGLMRTRTVPLSRYIIPRLRRIVRQVSGELDKPVTFDVNNAGGELDRSMIERMVAPLEHVLRNAIDHGIENDKERQQQGKPELGVIRLDIRREGGDVVLELSDDGRGIDVAAVRKKAIANELMSKDDDLSDEDVMKFIFAAGFSTAKELTQISGRGVGMDVVQSEMTALGGSVEVISRAQQGTMFIFRLPFTVSMNRALLVSAGGETLAVPLDSIEGIVRVSPFELEEYYGENAAKFFYAGQQYEFDYLGSLLNGSQYQASPEMLAALPVLLVRGGDKFVALQVDRLLGSREIVVKSLGKQFANLEGIAGATVLGDGSVVMIADLVALVRSEHARSETSDVVSLDKKRDNLLAMVVDDSVTVRKVTTRLLERRGMDVVTAKDGLDAILQLDDVKPDFILLDIEMPRMDGFEVVARIKNDPKLADIPIIMITSRTGDKHRERALGLGANGYLGKPYQEAVLFEAINKVMPQTLVDEQFGT